MLTPAICCAGDVHASMSCGKVTASERVAESSGVLSHSDSKAVILRESVS